MGKNGKKSVTVEVNAVPVSPKQSEPDPWQTRQDAEDLMRPHMLRMDKKRHSRAIEAMRKTVDHEDRIMGKGRAKQGRKTSARNIGRR